MSLTHSITLRLSADKRFMYETEAAYKGQSLGIYVRERLEKTDAYFQEIQQLKKKLESPSASSSLSSFLNQQSLQVELLLLLRLLAGPEKMLWVQKELSRLKLPLWEGDVAIELSTHAK